MNDRNNLNPPALLAKIEEATFNSGFSMASDHQAGSLLRTLAATKPEGKILELGTGTGLSACWLLDGMDPNSSLTTVDNDQIFVNIAQEFLANDARVEFVVNDGSKFIAECEQKYDLIFADAWPGKYSDLDATLNLLAMGGIYIIDDMLPQENWPDNHASNVESLINTLENNDNFHITKLNWSSGIILVTKG